MDIQSNDQHALRLAIYVYTWRACQIAGVGRILLSSVQALLQR